MISYELALGLSLVGVLILTGSFSLRDIVDHQAGTWILEFNISWYIFPVRRLLHLPDGRLRRDQPHTFDLPEAESELVAGYHTEYSSMKFAMFFMAEYANMVTVACLATLLFFGGYSGPTILVSLPPICPGSSAGLLVRAQGFLFFFLYIWVRGTLPRFRYDQLMAFGWKFLSAAGHRQHHRHQPDRGVGGLVT